MNVHRLLSIFKRRIQSLYHKHIPKNLKYRPTGYYKHVEDYIRQNLHEGILYEIVYPAHTSVCEFEPSFYNHIKQDLKPPKKVIKPAGLVLHIPGGRVFGDPTLSNIAIIDMQNKVIGDVSFQYKNNRTVNKVSENAAFSQKYFPAPYHIEGTVFSMVTGYGAVDNYFHWMFDVLPRLHLLQKTGIEVDYYLVSAFDKEYQQETFKAFGISYNQVIDFSKHRHISAEQLLVSNSAGDIVSTVSKQNVHYTQWCIDYLRNMFPPRICRFPVGQAIYISRIDSELINVVNEEELLPVLNEFGIEVYNLSDLNVRNCADLFQSARLVIAPHGTTLTNIVFCNPGTKVLEIFPDTHVNGLFAFIAEKNNLNHDFFIGRGIVKKNIWNKADIKINIERFKKKLNKIMAE